MIKLRPYQVAAVDAFFAARARGVRAPAIVLPTGAGKTVVFAEIIRRALAQGCPRALILSHRDELQEQAADKVRSVLPDVTVGIVAAERNNTGAQVIAGSVQTLRNLRRLAQLHNVRLVVTDEAHHATAQSYRTIYEALDCQMLGVTATMERGDGAKLGSVWDEIVYERTIREMVMDGFLVPARGIHVKIADLDLSKVKASRGDFSEGALGAAMTESMAPERIVDAYLTHASGRQAIAFGPTVEFAELMAAEFVAAGVRCAVVHANTPKGDRRRILADVRAGRIDVLSNCGVFTEGTDLPMVSCVIIARPTKSAALFIQMVGRGFRIWPGKRDCIVLDVVGATRTHGLASLSNLDDGEDPHEPPDGDGEGREPQEEWIGTPPPPPVWRDGKLVYEEVDLFRDSHSQWLQTNAGVWFLPAGECYVALVPGALGWDVVRMHRRNVGAAGWVQRGIPELSYAMAWGEGDVSIQERMLTEKSAKWRSGKPSDAQVRLAGRWGIEAPDLMTRGALSNAITVAEATRRIDSRLTPLMRSLLTSQAAMV